MTSRQRLANRRLHETVEIEHEGQRFYVGLGRQYICDGSCGNAPKLSPIAEVFLNARKKVNSPLDVWANDGAILISMLLQYGCPPADIFHAMKRNPDGSPASPLGCAASYLVEENSNV